MEINSRFEDHTANGTDDSMKDRYLSFYISGELYAVDIVAVIEIIGLQKITHVPNVPDFVEGIINLRGLIVPVVDIRCRFGLPPAKYTDKACIVVVKAGEDNVGIIVEDVSEVMKISDAHISGAPVTNKGTKSKFIRSVGKIAEKVIFLLDLNTLLFENAAGSADNG
jgi:purine-binding chemotaxis protein CheW